MKPATQGKPRLSGRRRASDNLFRTYFLTKPAARPAHSGSKPEENYFALSFEIEAN
jgi:hypothetical protein